LPKKLTNRPLFLKLSLGNINIKKLKIFEVKKLVDALVFSNSIGPGMRINIKTQKEIV